MSDYKPKEGDRVRVVIEGEVGYIGYDKTWFTVNGHEIMPTKAVSVEKIEPPVEVFKPGDVLRHRYVRQCLYTLTHTGFVEHRTAKFWPNKDDTLPFTSEYYEKVEIPSAH